jgi:2-amino-4-hydroxy-6-hydroxymethyldihydropteridine diphosphokinase
MPKALIGLGSNIGDRAATLNEALRLLEAHPALRVQSCSTFLKTRPVGGPDGQGEFLNAAAILETTLPPLPLLRVLQKVEQRLGRVRNVRWDERTLDLDLLLYQDLRWCSPELEIPHPRMTWRTFALLPAVEIAPDWRHPTIGWTLTEILHHLQQTPNYLAISSPRPERSQQLAHELEQSLGSAHMDAESKVTPETSQDNATKVHLLAFSAINQQNPLASSVPDASNPDFEDLHTEDPNPEELDLTDAKATAPRHHPGLRHLQSRAFALHRALAPLPRNSATSWLISDFWLPETLLNYPLEIQPLERGHRLPDEYEALLASAYQPKLLVWLDDPQGTLNDNTHSLRTKLLQNYYRGPRLIGHVDRGPEVFREVRAALEAM